MPRTTIDIDVTVLQELKRRQQLEGKSLGQLVSELLARALSEDDGEDGPKAFDWTVSPMRALVDLEDDEAVRSALER